MLIKVVAPYKGRSWPYALCHEQSVLIYLCTLAVLSVKETEPQALMRIDIVQKSDGVATKGLRFTPLHCSFRKAS